MIKWDDKYSVDISLIDEQHKKLFELINKADLVEKFSNNPKDVLAVLDQMTEYAISHFEAEECYMKEFNFTGYEPHRNEHIDFTNTAIEYKNRVVDGDYQITNEILEYLKQWLVNHIQVTDKKYIDCFKRNGL
jgi:hemerythrin